MSDTDRPFVVAIDGPAGAGKSSTAKAVAAELGLQHLDSGAFYRAVTLAALQRGTDPDSWRTLGARELDGWQVRGELREGDLRMTISGQSVGAALRGPGVNAHVSRMAAVPAVRAWLLEALRSVAGRTGVVADGRDIGTVVFPDASLKIFLVAEPEERARRRLRQQGRRSPTRSEVVSEAERLRRRDELDSRRAADPLRRASDAVGIDTTELSFSEQVREIVRLARERHCS